MDLDDTMYNGDVPTPHLENEYLPSHYRLLFAVGEEEKVTTIESRLHATTAHKVQHNFLNHSNESTKGGCAKLKLLAIANTHMIS